MKRAWLGLLVPVCSSACERGGRADTVSPDPARVADADTEVVASGESLPIIAVPQRLLSIDPGHWRFDPSGRLIAEPFTDADTGVSGCGIWDIESGTLVREYVNAGVEHPHAADPCLEWDESGKPSDSSADGKLRAVVLGGLEIETIGGSSRSVRGCASCDHAMAWAPSGHQLATCNGKLLEIWDADTGKRLRTETLGLDHVVDVSLGWTDDGVGVVVQHEISAPCKQLEPEGAYCYYQDSGEQPIDGVALSSFWWPADGRRSTAKIAEHKSVEALKFHTDPGVRWLAFSRTVGHGRDGFSTTLNVFGVGPRTSSLGWTEADSDDWIESWDGRWRVDAVSQWIEGLTAGDGQSNYGAVQVGWIAIVAEPDPTVFHGQMARVSGIMPRGEIEVLGASAGAAAARWQACLDGEDHGCKSGGPPVGDCELLDVSPLLSLALVRCQAGLRLIEASGRGSTVLSLSPDPDSTWRWGRGNDLALLDPDGKLEVVDLATGKQLYRRADVVELLEVPLAPEQGRLALAYADHLELVDGSTGTPVIDVPGDWVAAALSPDGEQLATLGGRRVDIIDIASGAVIATAPVGDALRVAWRQDGAALFHGHDWPTHAIDPETGALLYEVSHTILDVLALEEIDPSWRWIHRPDGSITRTLDFARIELGPSWARIESGMFEGELQDLPANMRFRTADDPDATAIHTAADLEPWLRTPGLIRAFFEGQPLPTPRVPVEALANLNKKKQG